MNIAPFFADQPTPVQAVLVTAELRELVTEDTWRLLVADRYPHVPAGEFDHLADRLAWIDRLGYDSSPAALREFYESPGLSFTVGADQFADILRSHLQAEVVSSAQLIASVRAAA